LRKRVSLLLFWMIAGQASADLLDEDELKHEAAKKAAIAPEGGLAEPKPHSSKPNGRDLSIPPKKAETQAKSTTNEPVKFTSRGLKGLKEAGKVELSEDVVVTQGELKMESDKAEIFFNEATREVMKVVCEGNVKVAGVDPNSGERFRALGNSGVYLNRNRTVVLEGNAKLWRGEDSVIRSKKITYEMQTGWIKADRVAGEVKPPENTQKKGK